ncbi:cation efflux family-domain-containing protein [Pseudomassariella vexata]|uniref:Cation efflux family-domain-containing protein n=1 Tax=Pseudomassariella vexata TaxID=1141098 RepID=A0A1Y2EJT6_9PEZI|nr:cation efflux family-domain-containing protein [Pseudomassariella vexata]ORY71767.1 cation efflux family-domain-containing protein [Pseudomassariella vexata]
MSNNQSPRSSSVTVRSIPLNSTIHHNGASTGVEANDEGEQPVSRHPSTMAGTDVESQTVRRYSGSDPYNLSLAYKTDEQLDEIKANTSRKRASAATKSKTSILRCVPGRDNLHARKVQTFYKTQNETIQRLLKTVEEHRAEAKETQGDDHLRHQIAVYGSFAANVILSILQLYGAISSGSLSLFTTMADSVFDPLSNITLILTHRAVKKVDPSRFPSGKARLETVGNTVFCFLMTAVSFILIAFSAQDLADTNKSGVNNFHLPSVIAVTIAFATKFFLFLYCWGLKDKYSQIDILWQDHRNDLLINGFGILTSVGGSKLVWWLDPMGAIILSLLISAIWLRTAFHEFMLLVGVVSSVEMQQLITYVCLTHSPAILGIDTVRVYHSGPRLIAEVDVVMDPDSTLRDTHDVAEELQFKLEDLPDVERAYVHVDYETTHKPEHAFKKDI